MPTTTRDRFKINIPLEITKSDENGWRVRGVASTEDKDLQGEIVRQSGLDIAALKNGRGLFNYEHRNDPENIVGVIEDAEVTDDGLVVDGYLFKNHKRAQAIAEIMGSLQKDHTKRVQLSIEGKVQQRGEDHKEIAKAAVDRVAITFEPVNSSTYLEFAKSLLSAQPAPEVVPTPVEGSDPKELLISQELEEEINKTMTAGYGGESAPAERTGGAALQPESLDAKVATTQPTEKPKMDKKKKKLVAKAIMKSLMKKMMVSMPDNLEIAGSVHLIKSKPYILEPNGVYSPLGHNGE